MANSKKRESFRADAPTPILCRWHASHCLYASRTRTRRTGSPVCGSQRTLVHTGAYCSGYRPAALFINQRCVVSGRSAIGAVTYRLGPHLGYLDLPGFILESVNVSSSPRCDSMSAPAASARHSAHSQTTCKRPGMSTARGEMTPPCSEQLPHGSAELPSERFRIIVPIVGPHFARWTDSREMTLLSANISKTS